VSEQQPEPTTPSEGAATPEPPAATPAPPATDPAPTAPSVAPYTPTPAAPLSESDSRLWAMLGHLGGIVLGFLAPLITWLVFRDRSELVDDQGKEALNFQITVLIGYVICWVLAGVTLGLLFFLPFLIWVVNIIFCIIAGLAANKGEHYRYPFAIRLVK
jgi:uncharacterized Tic20 family protein